MSLKEEDTRTGIRDYLAGREEDWLKVMNALERVCLKGLIASLGRKKGETDEGQAGRKDSPHSP